IRAVSSGVDDIYSILLDGRQERRLTSDRRFVISAAWSADGRDILFSSNRGGSHTLWRVGAAGATPPERVMVRGENASDPVFSRDGSRMAYSQFYIDA